MIVINIPSDKDIVVNIQFSEDGKESIEVIEQTPDPYSEDDEILEDDAEDS
ncbi:hypothetical protein V2H45_23420 [Tumidithrix elongata RA019]|uniref:Uncharacterized protein n=1 Tax=Tumidithrix elongata BACA0141 TaxID=2716417 RepID=A0AAW9Q3J6_9CYAN|nr:hypothetical protein [Tumidithrix elongata RA019]